MHQLIQSFYDKQIHFGDTSEICFCKKLAGLCIWSLGIDKAILLLNNVDTRRILDDFPEVDTSVEDEIQEPEASETEKLMSVEQRQKFMPLFLEYISEIQKGFYGSNEPQEAEFTIAIPFYSHLDYLKQCLDSIALSVKQVPDIPVEILIVNDDPKILDCKLATLVPDALQGIFRIISNDQNLGICQSLNRAIAHSRYNWIVHIDCDDRLTENCLKILTQRIHQYPTARYISSRMLDIDKNGNLLRCRLRPEKPFQLISHGMVAGHLKAIHKNIFRDIGGYLKDYEGCQDYEFALRASFFEPLLFIPDYLYQYRWHGSTQSVSKAKRQTDTTNKIVDTYLLAGMIISPAHMPVSLTFQGDYAASWQNGFANDTLAVAQNRSLTVEVHSSFNDKNRKLFAIFLARYLMNHPNLKEAENYLTFYPDRIYGIET